MGAGAAVVINGSDDERTSHAAQQRQVLHEELVQRLARAIDADGLVVLPNGLKLGRASAPTDVRHGVFDPSLCVIAQGSKEILLGDTRYRYDPAHYLIATAALPFAGRVVEASPEHPYLSLALSLDPTLISSVMVEVGHLPPRGQTAVTAIDVSPLDVSLLDAVVRLVRLLDAPTDARVLAPLIQREIVYRLLTGAQSGRLHQVVAVGGDAQRIIAAIERLRNNFNEPLRIEHLARDLGMSASSFHHHFKAITALSPLQFQKQLRLQTARRLMLGEHLDAASAGYRVGYDDPAHFNREYKRFFGTPPMRDIVRLREATAETAGV